MKYFIDPSKIKIKLLTKMIIIFIFILVLFFSDIITDVLVLIAYSEGGHDYYYNALLTAMICERTANIAFTLGFILTRKHERNKTCQNMFVVFLNFIYLDPIAGTYFIVF